MRSSNADWCVVIVESVRRRSQCSAQGKVENQRVEVIDISTQKPR